MKVTLSKDFGDVTLHEMTTAKGVKFSKVVAQSFESTVPVSFNVMSKLLNAAFYAGKHQVEERQREYEAGDDW